MDYTPTAGTGKKIFAGKKRKSVSRELPFLLPQRPPHPLGGKRQMFDADAVAAGEGVGNGEVSAYERENRLVRCRSRALPEQPSGPLLEESNLLGRGNLRPTRL